MRWLRRCPASIGLCVSLVSQAPFALPMALTGCTAPALTPASLASDADAHPGGAGTEAIAAMLRARQDEASLMLPRWFAASTDASCNQCLSAAEQDAIIERALAEHEMRRP